MTAGRSSLYPTAAEFVRYVDGLLLGERPRPIDWNHHMVQHYPDDALESARRLAVKQIAVRHDGNARKVTVAERAELERLLAPLRGPARPA